MRVWEDISLQTKHSTSEIPMRLALAVLATSCCALGYTSAFGQSFSDRTKGGYEVRGAIFFPTSDKGLIIIQRGSTVLTCDFDKVTHESGSGIKPGNCRELDK
jgi:hypothetical protein